VNAAVKLLQIVRRDLEDAIQICKGEKKQTNFHRSMISDLAKGILPSHWRCYTVPSGCTVIQWITDFSDRIKQLQKVSTASISGGTSALKNLHVWLGGLFNPEAYITATRQYVAQANGWSLEELAMKVIVTDKDLKPPELDECSFGVTGLKLQGAECKNSQLYLTLTISADLPVTILRWIKKTEVKPSGPEVTLPVYLNTTRSELLFTVNLPMAGQQKEHSFYERGVAVICSSALG
ncbi:Dynein heavy chain, cytoplasmic, partial [Araneus ventricosus]